MTNTLSDFWSELTLRDWSEQAYRTSKRVHIRSLFLGFMYYVLDFKLNA